MTPDNAIRDLHVDCSSSLKQIMLNGMEEVIGSTGVNLVLNRSGLAYQDSMDACSCLETHDFLPELSHIQSKLEEIYGVGGGRGLALRTGRACFSMGLRQYGKRLGLLDMDYRLLPPLRKIQIGLKKISHFLNEDGHTNISIEGDAKQLRWIVEKCPICLHRQADDPSCHFYIGLLQEFSYWASGGKNYPIEEIECAAMGAEACVIAIDKQPIG